VRSGQASAEGRCSPLYAAADNGRSLALMAYQSEVWETGIDQIDGGHLNILCIAVEEALRVLHPSV
jgi:hypothetical protein